MLKVFLISLAAVFAAFLMTEEGVRAIDRLMNMLVWAQIRRRQEKSTTVTVSDLEKFAQLVSSENRMQRLLKRGKELADGTSHKFQAETVELVWAQLVVDGHLRSDTRATCEEIEKAYDIKGNDSIRLLKCVLAVDAAIDQVCGKCVKESTVATTWEGSEAVFLELYDALFDLSSSWEAVQDSETPEPIRAPGRKPTSKGGIDWVALGFQGSDPSTDFRGTGAFGLRCFANFCIKYPSLAQQILVQSGSMADSASARDEPWYPVALVSIHLSLLLLNAMRHERGMLFRCFVRLGGLISGPTGEKNSDVDYTNSVECMIKECHVGLLLAFHKHWLRGVQTGSIESVLVTERELNAFQDAARETLWEGRVRAFVDELP